MEFVPQMKIAQFPAIQQSVVSGQRKGGNATEASHGNSVLREPHSRSPAKATFVDRSQPSDVRLSSRSSIPARLLNQKAIDTYSVNSTYSLSIFEGELIGVDLHA